MYCKISSVKRDPFARSTLMREYDPNERNLATCKHLCAWCGNGPAKYRYAWDSDDNRNRVEFRGKDFCSIDCWRYYNNC